ncbi:MAG: LL-diaminopimelate aminotransferase [Clostridiales bacterium]|nr:LL-diaminopimelate aminotransferase [Clostridiales bacterium]
MNIKANTEFLNIKETYLFSEVGKRLRVYTEANPGKRLIRMGIGDVTRPLPQIVTDALCKAAMEMGNAETFRGYPPESGYGFLRESIVRYYARSGITLSPDDIFVSDGAKSDIGNLPDILGDNEVIIPDPVYPVYVDSNLMNGRRIRFIEGNIENGFLPLPDGIKEPSVIYLCSPNNPTGAVYDRNGLKAWVDCALETGSLILFDAAYEAFITDDLPKSIYEIEGADKCAIEVCSFSKFAGFTGLRCGWTVVPKGLMAGEVDLWKLWFRRQSTKFNGVSYPVQRAAEAALSDEGIKKCLENVSYYRNNASLLADVFASKGIRFTGGKNSPYIWLECPGGMGSWDFFDFLLNEVQIAGTPGEGFGRCGEGFFRLTGFGSLEDTKEAAERLKKLL